MGKKKDELLLSTEDALSKIDPSQVFDDATAAEATTDSVAESEVQDVTPDSSTGDTKAEDVEAESSTATPAEAKPDDQLPFGKHPRWQEVLRERDDARKRAEDAETERQQLRDEAEQLRQERAQLRHLEYLDQKFRADPAALARAERMAEYLDAVGGDEPRDAADAELRLLKSRMGKLEQDKQAGERAAYHRQLYDAEVSMIVGELDRAQVPAKDRENIGSIIHAKYRENRERGLNVTPAKIAKDVLDFLAAHAGQAVERFKTGKQANPAASGQDTLKKGGGRVPISAEAEQHRTMLERDKESGLLKPNWSKMGAAFTRQVLEGRGG